MATFPGWVAPSPTDTGKNPHITSALSELLADDIWPPAHNAAGIIEPTGYADNLPVDQPAAGTVVGRRAPSYVLDFYFRVHIVPSSIAFGAVLTRVSRLVEVWSAHFVSNTLQSIDEQDTEGLTLLGPENPPTLFLPLDSRNYTLDADVNGPTRIDALYTFNFTLDTSTLAVVGDRVLPFPFPPDWSRPVIERLQWRTDIQQAHNGKERRIQVREGARLSYEYALLHGGDDERVILENLLHAWQARLYGVPLWHQVERLDAALPVGSTSVPTDTTTSDYIEGGIAALVDGLTAELIEIDSIQPTGLTLATATINAFPVGAKVMPARLGQLPISQGIDYPSDAIVGGVVRFDGFLEELPTPASETAEYRGYPVYRVRRDWIQEVGAVHDLLAERIDYGVGRTIVDERGGYTLLRRSHGWLLGGRQAVADFRSFLAARTGRLRPLWLPTGHRDIELVGTVGTTDTTMLVAHRFHYRVAGQLGRQDLRMTLQDGSEFFRRIDDVDELSPTTERLVIDAPFGVEVNPEDVVRIEYMGLVRLDADGIELAHETDAITRIQAAWRTLRDDVP